MDIAFLQVVKERDIDLLLLEELYVSVEFRKWFWASCGLSANVDLDTLRAWHSVSHPALGESDLVVIASNSDGRRTAVLVEDKVNAPPQPEQAMRYQKRGRAGVDAGEWDHFKTCLVAPEKYIKGSKEADQYDESITYEEIESWLLESANGDPRAEYRAQVINRAIEQQRKGYSPDYDEQVTSFWHAYWERASDEFPELTMPAPGPKPSKSGWIDFCQGETGEANRLVHKLSKGCVDLQFGGMAGKVDFLREANSLLLKGDVTVEVTSKSAVFRIKAPEVDRFSDFDEQLREAREGMKAAFRLMHMAKLISTT